MNPTDDLGLPPAPPLPPDVRERALRTVLDGLDGLDAPARPDPGARRGRLPRWAPLLTAAAVVALVAIAAAAALALPRTPPAAPGPPVPLPGPTAAPDPSEDLGPLPNGVPAPGPSTSRCAAALQLSGQRADYPPFEAWRATLLLTHLTPLEDELAISDSFGCLLTPTTAVVTALSGPSVGGVQVLGLTDRELVLLNPQRRPFTIGPPRDPEPDTGEAVVFYRLDEGVSLADLRITVPGADGYDGPVPPPAPPVTVTDQPLPPRPDSPLNGELDRCLDDNPSEFPRFPELWVPVGRHDVGGDPPPALVTRIGDLFAGFCAPDPAHDRTVFYFDRMPDPSDRPELVMHYRGGATAALLTVPAWVTRMVVAPERGTTAPADCTLLDGLAMCTLDGPPGDDRPGPRVVVTAYTAADPRGTEVFRG